MPDSLNGKKFYEQGNFDLMTQPLDVNGNPEYTGEIAKIKGMMSLSLTFSQTTTDISADDDPSYLNFTSPLIADGTLTLVGISKSQYEQFYSVYKDSNDATVFDGKPNPYLGLTYKDTYYAGDGTEVINKITLNKVRMSLPPWETASKAEENPTIRNIAIPIKAVPLRYTKKDGTPGNVTMSIINNVDHSAIWSKAKDIIYVPDKVFG